MQTKRYEVLSINEGMARIKDDLGPNAIILSRYFFLLGLK
jgi:flagellar biosynthesis GTPase FlhF